METIYMKCPLCKKEIDENLINDHLYYEHSQCKIHDSKLIFSDEFLKEHSLVDVNRLH